MVKIRLVKVVVQPIFVEDDGESLSEIGHHPVEVSAIDWPEYSGTIFPKQVEEWQEKLNDGSKETEFTAEDI